MYNRYIGNTGKFYRVEGVEQIEVPQWEQMPIPTSPLPPRLSQPGPVPPPVEPARTPLPPPGQTWAPPVPPEPVPFAPPLEEEKRSKFDLGSMLNMPGNLRGTLMGWVPEKLDLGDILLVLMLIYLFLEGDDDDMLIILGVLAFTWIWPLFKRGEE